MKKYFIAGAGTDIGKTAISAALAWQLRAKGKQVRVLKPVVSGFDVNSLSVSDTGILLAAQGMDVTLANADTISPWRFAEAVSPDMAAQAEGKIINTQSVIDFCKSQMACEYLLIEGAGGAMTPVNERHTMLDIMIALNIPAWLVAGTYLGSISHTLTTYEAVANRGVKIDHVVINESKDAAVNRERHTATLERLLPSGQKIISIPRLDSSEEVWKYMPDISKALL